jgi:hypothetical protein
MSPVEDWYSERPRRPPAAYACELAKHRFWRDEQRRLIATHHDLAEVAPLLELEGEPAHALVLVLSRLPKSRRRAFADAFYEERRRTRSPIGSVASVSTAAAVALLVLELGGDELDTPRIRDLLQGAAQGDDLTWTPPPALAELRKAIARVRMDVELEDPAHPRGAAALAVAEVLDPAGEVVALQEVVARAAWAAVETWEAPRVLAFLLELDRIFVPDNEERPGPGPSQLGFE